MPAKVASMFCLCYQLLKQALEAPKSQKQAHQPRMTTLIYGFGLLHPECVPTSESEEGKGMKCHSRFVGMLDAMNAKGLVD
jgi:hypothetical protein